MRTLTILATIVLSALLLSSASPEPACAGLGCGLKPLKPLVPLGCSDVCAECHCDSQGRNCRWIWVCC